MRTNTPNAATTEQTPEPTGRVIVTLPDGATFTFSREAETRGRALGVAAELAPLVRASQIVTPRSGAEAFRVDGSIAFRDVRELAAEKRLAKAFAKENLAEQITRWQVFNAAQPRPAREPTDLFLRDIQQAQAVVELLELEIKALDGMITKVDEDQTRRDALRRFTKSVAKGQVGAKRNPQTGVWEERPVGVLAEDEPFLKDELAAWRTERAQTTAAQ